MLRATVQNASIILGSVVTLLTTLTGPASAQPQHRARETIQVGLIDRTFFPQPVFVAIQNGYFADEGFNANIRFIRSGEGQAAGLTEGRPQFRAVLGRGHHPERRARRTAAHDRGELRQAQPFHHHAEEICHGRGPRRAGPSAS